MSLTMTMLQRTPVVPSNAPPQTDGFNGQTSGVLQEHSGNRQRDYYAASLEQKYPSPYLTENNYTAHQHVPRAHVSDHTLVQHNRFRHHKTPNGQRDPQQIRKEARYLFQRFRSSDGYMKYRNRQQTDDKGVAEQKWPDRLEYAFFEALVNWPPMGRRQLFHKGKRRGRNELITDYIEEHTGESRSRKQVSSHIQVLKSFVETDPHIMRYLSKDDLSGHGSAHRYYTQGHGYYSTGGRRASQYPATAPGFSTRSSTAIMDDHNSYHMLSETKKQLSVFQPKDFEMFVQRKYETGDVQRLHKYTANIPTPLQAELQPTRDEFATDFPLLAEMHTTRKIDCNVLFADASIAFPTDSWKGTEGIELGISLSCTSQNLPQDAQVFCCNRFYRQGELVKGHGSTDHVPLGMLSEDGSCVEAQVKFGSTFWARTLAALANKLKVTAEDITDGQDPRAAVDQYLRDTIAYQEIVIKMPDNTPQSLLVIYWKFRLSTASQGRAYWRPIRVPSSTSTEVSSSPYKANTYVSAKNERVDSVFDYSTQLYTNEAYATAQPTTLQSPFEYDSSSASGSALHSTTWPSSASFDVTDGTSTAPQSAVDLFPPSADNSFDFTGGNINISYDTMDLSTFDPTAFDFSTSTDFVTDPALENYDAQDFSQQEFDTQWYDNFGEPQQTQAPQAPQAPMIAGATSAELAQEDKQGQHHYNFDLPPPPPPPTTCGVHDQAAPAVFNDYHTATYDSQQQHYSQIYGTSPHEGQAYGGAGQDAIVKPEGPLAALAGASRYMADHIPQERAGSPGYDPPGQQYPHAP